MRLRERRRIEKRARVAARQWREFAGAGPERLLAIAVEPSRGWYIRGEALLLLGLKNTPGFLLEEFFAGETELEIWEAALTLEHAGGPDVIEPLVGALCDPNLYRRQAAARALGWNRNSGPASAKALVAILNDSTQPQRVRSEACESLAYIRWPQSVPALIAASKEPDVKIRFWAAFGLGGICDDEGELDARAFARLEEMLSDTEVCSGWWSVGHEALSMLSKLPGKYRDMETREKERIGNDANSSAEDRRWAQ